MEKELILGLMAGRMRENGKKTTWTAMVSISGKMGEGTKVTTKMTRNMAKEFTHGLMANNTMDHG